MGLLSARLLVAQAVDAHGASAAIALISCLLLFGDSLGLRVAMIAGEILAINIEGMEHQRMRGRKLPSQNANAFAQVRVSGTQLSRFAFSVT